MKTVKFLTIVSGPEFSGYPGSIALVSDETADGLVGSGSAELIEESPVVTEPEA